MDNQIIDEWAAELGPTALMVLFTIARHANNDTRESWPRYGLIQAKTGLSRATVKRAVRRLVKLGFLDVIYRRGMTPIYILRPCPIWEGEGSVVDVQEVDVDEKPEGSTVNPLNEKPEGSPVTPGGVTSDPPPSNAPRCNEKDYLTTPTREVVGGDELGQKNAEAAKWLAELGVMQNVADDISNTRDVGMIGETIRFYQAKVAAGEKIGLGVLVKMLRNYAEYGIRKTEDGWTFPPFPAPKGGKTKDAPKPQKTQEQRLKEVAEARKRAEADKANEAAFRNSPSLKASLQKPPGTPETPKPSPGSSKPPETP